MKLNRKHYGMKRRSAGGQAILEYIIIIALVAVAALTVLGLFGDRIRGLIASVTKSIGGDTSDANIETGASLDNLQNAADNDDITF